MVMGGSGEAFGREVILYGNWKLDVDALCASISYGEPGRISFLFFFFDIFLYCVGRYQR